MAGFQPRFPIRSIYNHVDWRRRSCSNTNCRTRQRSRQNPDACGTRCVDYIVGLQLQFRDTDPTCFRCERRGNNPQREPKPHASVSIVPKILPNPLPRPLPPAPLMKICRETSPGIRLSDLTPEVTAIPTDLPQLTVHSPVLSHSPTLQKWVRGPAVSLRTKPSYSQWWSRRRCG